MEEVWKPIKDYEGLYEISSLGRVKNLNYRGSGKGEILKNTECSDGYLMVVLRKNGKPKTFRVHKLVAEAFIPNPEDKPCIDHINTIRNDNRVENLRWVTYEENNNNPLTRKKRSETNKGENNPNYGKHHSEETRKKISEASKGKAKSEEHKKKLGEAHKSENNPCNKPVVQIDLNTNEVVNIYFSVGEAVRQTGFSRSGISACCRGKRKLHKGYKWKFLSDYN